MLFSEVYGAYFRCLDAILSKAAAGTLTRAEMEAIIAEKGFEESIVAIPKNLSDQTWPLLKEDLTTPLGKPGQPLTILEKRWLKALLADPRIKLFDPPTAGLEDVEPLYPPDAIVYFDRYSDGDPFDDPAYIGHFRTILTALREKRWLKIEFSGRNGVPHFWRCVPYKLEYSPKDDKFRLITGNNRTALSVNLARIVSCTLLEPCLPEEYHPSVMRKQALVLELTDTRNALERCLLHFSHLEKETERIGGDRYRLTLRYEKEDETELLIRVLSFGPVLKVISPERFKNQLRYRLRRQLHLKPPDKQETEDV